MGAKILTAAGLKEFGGGGYAYVDTGGVVGTARPNVTVVEWFHEGDTQPTNMAVGDIWVGKEQAIVDSGDSGWINVTVFTNSWLSYGAGYEPGYRKINGIVYLRGILKSGVIGSEAFTLPAGFRPGATWYNATQGNNGSTRIVSYSYILSNGGFTPYVGSNVEFHLHNISFPADG